MCTRRRVNSVWGGCSSKVQLISCYDVIARNTSATSKYSCKFCMQLQYQHITCMMTTHARCNAAMPATVSIPCASVTDYISADCHQRLLLVDCHVELSHDLWLNLHDNWQRRACYNTNNSLSDMRARLHFALND
jgi:hypothetical protein